MNTPTVLIVEDDEQFSRYLVELLSQNGFQVATAPDGRTGIVRCEQTNPDVVLLDLVMPEMDGIETIQEISKLYPDIPVITMSGGNHGPAAVYLRVTEKLGAYKTLAKPFDGPTLLQYLEGLFPSHEFEDI